MGGFVDTQWRAKSYNDPQIKTLQAFHDAYVIKKEDSPFVRLLKKVTHYISSKLCIGAFGKAIDTIMVKKTYTMCSLSKKDEIKRLNNYIVEMSAVDEKTELQLAVPRK